MYPLHTGQLIIFQFPNLAHFPIFEPSKFSQNIQHTARSSESRSGDSFQSVNPISVYFFLLWCFGCKFTAAFSSAIRFASAAFASASCFCLAFEFCFLLCDNCVLLSLFSRSLFLLQFQCSVSFGFLIRSICFCFFPGSLSSLGLLSVLRPRVSQAFSFSAILFSLAFSHHFHQHPPWLQNLIAKVKVPKSKEPFPLRTQTGLQRTLVLIRQTDGSERHLALF